MLPVPMKPNFLALSPALIRWTPRRPFGRERRLLEGPGTRFWPVFGIFGLRVRVRRLRRGGHAVVRIVLFIFDGQSPVWFFGAFSTVRGLIEGLFGHPEGVHGRRHAAVEDHLGDYLRYLLTGNADVERPGDVPLDHLRTVAQDHQSRDGAKAAGLQVHGRSIVDLAVDHRVHQTHDLGRQLGHGRRRHWVVVRTVIPLPKIDGGLVQVFGVLLWGFFRAHDISRFRG